MENILTTSSVWRIFVLVLVRPYVKGSLSSLKIVSLNWVFPILTSFGLLLFPEWTW